MNPNYPQILNNIRTKEEASDLITCIETLLSSLYTKGVDTRTLIAKTIPAEFSGAILDDLTKQNVAIQNLESIQKYFEDLRQKTGSLKIFSLSIPFQPTYSFVTTLHQWTIENLGQGIILNLQIDPSLRAGAIVEYGGIYRDYSIRKQLEDIFANKRAEILSQQVK